MKEALERMQVFVLIWINTHSLDQVLGGKPKLSEIPRKPEEMYRDENGANLLQSTERCFNGLNESID